MLKPHRTDKADGRRVAGLRIRGRGKGLLLSINQLDSKWKQPAAEPRAHSSGAASQDLNYSREQRAWGPEEIDRACTLRRKEARASSSTEGRMRE